MRNLKIYLTLLILAFLYLILSIPTPLMSNIIIDDNVEPAVSSAPLMSNIIIDDDAEPIVSNLYLTSDYTDDAACIQAALDNSKSGDTITIREGDYHIKNEYIKKIRV